MVYSAIARLACVVCLLLVAPACDGRRSPTTDNSTTAGTPAMIPFPEERSASGLTEYVLQGASAEQLSAGAVPNGTALEINAQLDSFEYALYRFNAPGLGSPGELDSVSVLLESGATTEAWIGLADYATQRWQFAGPYNTSKTLSIDEPRYVSPGGDVWVAVVTAPAQQATVNALSVRTINPANLSPLCNYSRTPVLGNAPLTVNFDASSSSDPDGAIIEYAWDFDGDGLYDGFSDQPTATHTFITGANYRPKLRVMDDQGATATQDRSMNVNNPPQALLTTGTPKVNKGDTVFLDASGSSDSDGEIVDIEWDLDGNGIFSEAGSEANSQGKATFAALMGDISGEFIVSVRVADDVGAQDTVNIVLTVTGWRTRVVHEPVGNGWFTSLAEVSGRPAVAYYNATDTDLMYLYGSAVDTQDEWPVTIVDSVGAVGFGCSLAVVGGKPAIAYRDGTNQSLKFARSSSADGALDSDWQTITVDSTANVGTSASLAVVNGKPAISYYDTENGDLKYAYSTTSDGMSELDWELEVVDSTDNVGSSTSLAVVNGKPAISYRDITNVDLKYAYSSTPDGSSGWTTVLVDNAVTGDYTSLAIINGRPAISYYDIGNADLRYAYSSTADGSDSSWDSITVQSASDIGRFSSLALIDGTPAISYHDWNNKDLWFARSSSFDGSSDWSAWNLDSEGNVGIDTSLVVIAGRLSISYWDSANTQLKFAELFE